VEVAADVLVQGEVGTRLSALHIAAEGVPALAPWAAGGPVVVGEPGALQEAGARSHQVRVDLELHPLASGGQLEPRAGKPLAVEVECSRPAAAGNVDACCPNSRGPFRSRTLIGPGIDARLAGEGCVNDVRWYSKPVCNDVADRSFGRWRDGHDV